MLEGVVVNYRTPLDLEGFIASWLACSPDYARLTIVNVAPLQEDKDVAEAGASLASEQSKIARLLTFSANVGYSFACNKAAENSEADVLAFFNADTRLLPQVIEPIYKDLLTHGDWGVAGPRQVDEHNRLTHAGIMGTNRRPILRGWMQDDRGDFSDIEDDAVSVMGSAYFVKKECWEDLRDCSVFQALYPGVPGAFLPTQHYYEETWCSYHAREHGWKVIYYGPAKMIHRWHKASEVGGKADGQFPVSQGIFREMCDAHAIDRD